MNQTPYDYDPLTLPHAPKRDKPLSLWNPLDYLLLLYWVFYFPQALRWYVEKFGSLPYRTKGREAIREDPIQRKLALQGLLLTLIAPFVLASLLGWLGVPINMLGVAFVVAAGVVGGVVGGETEGVALGLALGVAGGMVGSVMGGVGVNVVIGVESIVLGIAGSVAGGYAGVVALFVMSGVMSGVMLSLILGVEGRVMRGVEGGVAGGVGGGMGVSICSIRLDSVLLGFISILFQYQQNTALLIQRSSPVPIPTLHHKLVTHLTNDWQQGLIESEGLLRYSLQFLPVTSAIQQVLIQFPSSLLLRRVSEWCSMPLYDWDIVFFQFDNLKARLQEQFWASLEIIPHRWPPQVNVELRFDTPPRAACAAFWLLHEERLAEAADAFKVVRELRHGEELYGNARAMAEGVGCEELGEIALWEAPLEPLDEVLRPNVREGLLLFGKVAEDAAIVVKSRSARQRNAALNRASGALDGFLKGLERYPTPERDNLARIAERWLKIVLSHASEVGTLEVREPVSSPYIVGAIVPPERLVGREDIFALLSAMWSKEGQRDSLVVYGHRRMGKSSIVRNVKHFCKLGADTGLAMLNLQSVDWAEELRDLCYAIALELWQALPTTVAEPEPDDFESRPLPALRRLLVHLHQAHPQRRYILILDEYEVLDKYLPQELASRFVTLLRGLTQQHPWLVMALVGLYTLEERSASYYQAIYAWRPIRVGLMDADAVADTLQLQTDDFPLEYSLAAVALAHQLSGGQPFLVQLIGDSLVQRFNRQLQQQLESPSPLFSAADIHAVVDDPHFYQQGDAYFKGIWKQAAQNPSGQHTILQTLAPHKEGHPLSTLQQATSLDDSTFNAALDALIRHDVILCQNDNCRYTVELMRRWVEGGER